MRTVRVLHSLAAAAPILSVARGLTSTLIGNSSLHQQQSTGPSNSAQDLRRAHSCLTKRGEALVHRMFASMAHDNYETVKVSTEDAIGLITISRPKALNALNDKASHSESLNMP